MEKKKEEVEKLLETAHTIVVDFARSIGSSNQTPRQVLGENYYPMIIEVAKMLNPR